MNEFKTILENHNVEVWRPENINNLNQIFVRDIAFVIEDKLIISNVIDERKDEVFAIHNLLDKINKSKIINTPSDVRIEGGDVMPWNNFVFIGYSEKEDFDTYKVSRTNVKGLKFIRSMFPDKIVKGFELNKSDTNPKENALHLDCCFQPFSNNKAIIYKEGFKRSEDVSFLINLFGEENIIFINQDEMYNMHSNILSVSEKLIISDKRFLRLNNEIRKFGIKVEEVNYSEIAKMEGLLRCSTLPIKRK